MLFRDDNDITSYRRQADAVRYRFPPQSYIRNGRRRQPLIYRDDEGTTSRLAIFAAGLAIISPAPPHSLRDIVTQQNFGAFRRHYHAKLSAFPAFLRPRDWFQLLSMARKFSPVTLFLSMLLY